MAFATLGGTTLHYRLAGPPAGPALVLANSLGTDARIWDDVIAALSDTYRILSYDKRGHGLSDAPPGPYKIDDHIHDLLGLADHVGFGDFALCGVSIGGLIAQGVALRAPHRLSGLILCDTAPKVGTPEMWNTRIEAVANAGVASISEAILARWFAPSFMTTHSAQYAGWKNLLERTPAHGYAATCASLRDADLTAQIHAITLPTLVVVGEVDGSTPPDLVRAMADLLPDARFKVIPGAGHIPSIEAPDALIALMRSYLAEIGHV